MHLLCCLNYILRLSKEESGNVVEEKKEAEGEGEAKAVLETAQTKSHDESQV